MRYATAPLAYSLTKISKLRGCLYKPVSQANSLNEVTTTYTQNDISKQNWLSLTVGKT